MEESSVNRLKKQVNDHSVWLIFNSLLLILCFAFIFYAAQKANKNDINFVAMALTIFEVFLVIALAGGFWMVRSAAIERAEDAARRVARDCAEAEAKSYAERFLTPRLVREIIAQSEDIGGGAALTEQSVDDIKNALD